MPWPATELFGSNPFGGLPDQQMPEAIDPTMMPENDSKPSTHMPTAEGKPMNQEEEATKKVSRNNPFDDEEDHQMAEVVDLTMMSDDEFEPSTLMPASDVKPVKQEEEDNPFDYLPDHRKAEVVDLTMMLDDDSEPSNHIPASDLQPVKQEEEDSMFVTERVLPEPDQVQIKAEHAQAEPEQTQAEPEQTQAEPEPGIAEQLDPVVKWINDVERHETQESELGISKDDTAKEDSSLARDEEHEHGGPSETQQNQDEQMDIRNGPDLASSEVPVQGDVAQQNDEFELLLDDLREYTAKRDKLQAELTKKRGPPIEYRRLKRLEQWVQDIRAELQLIRPSTQIEDLEKEPSLDAKKPGKEKNTPSRRHPRTAKEWFERHFQDPKRAAAQRKVQRILFKEPSTVPENPGKRRRTYKGHGKTDAILRRYFTAQSCSKIMEARMALQNLPESETKVLTTQRKQIEQTKAEALENCDEGVYQYDSRRLKQALQSFGLNNCKTDGSWSSAQWFLKGLRSRLRNHQLLGVHWMLEKEFGPDKGGILADEMGLGKTIQSLACMIHNKPAHADPKPTLIVVPAASITQWLSEIDKHVSPDPGLISTHYKSSKRENMKLLEISDVIVTSYQEVQASYIPLKIQRQIKSQEPTDEQKRDLHDKHLGVLHQMKFWRVVLDEAHAIKNHETQTSIACRHLKAKHRWALSGTPLHNTPLEIWPYLKFLNVPWAGELSDFSKRLELLDNPTNQEQLQTIIEESMMRRTMSDTIFGLPLWEAPEIHAEQKWITHSEEETIIYRTIETRYRKIVNWLLNKLRREGKAKKLSDIPFYMVYFTRLRQAAAHPFLLGSAIERTLVGEDYAMMRYQIGQLHSRTPFFDRIDIFCAEEMKRRSSESRQTPDMSTQVDMAMEMAEKDRHYCRECGSEDPTDLQQHNCGHVICLTCIHEMIYEPKEADQGKVVCPHCEEELREWHAVSIEEPEERLPVSFTQDELDAFKKIGTTPKEIRALLAEKRQRDLDTASQPSDNQGRDGNKLGNDYLNNQPRLKAKDTQFLIALDKEYPKPMVHSAKTKQVMNTVREWQNDAPDDKIIIFTQFLQGSMILGRMLQAKRIKFVYFFGQMPAKDKTAAIDTFHEVDEVKVMIASLKCGGVALNLTCANRVILVDPWWNTPMENQAFGRVYRMGQKKKTYLQSILVKSTIDRRMHNYQKDKIKNIDQAMKYSKSLSHEEAMNLMGNLTEDEGGNPVLEADYED